MASAVSILEKHRVFQDEKGRGAKQAMIEFAQYHVTQALIQASRKATMKVEYDDEAYKDSNEYGQKYVLAHEVERGGEYGEINIEEESILNSYPLENIQ